MTNTITASFVEPHFNVNAYANTPGYWIPNVVPVNNPQAFNATWPCDSEAEAIALGEQMVKDGIALAN